MKNPAPIVSIVATLLFALVACTEPALEPEPEPSPEPEADEVAPSAPAERIGDFCLMSGCDGQDYASEGGGDDQCEAMVGAPLTCCLANNICHRGIRFHGPCFALDPTPAEETCPEDANGNGICLVGAVYYSRCDD